MIRTVITKCDMSFEIKFAIDSEKTTWWYAGAEHKKICRNDCLFETTGVGHSLEEALKHRLDKYNETEYDWTGTAIKNIKTIVTQTNRLTFSCKGKNIIVKFNLTKNKKIRIKAKNLEKALAYSCKIIRRRYPHGTFFIKQPPYLILKSVQTSNVWTLN